VIKQLKKDIRDQLLRLLRNQKEEDRRRKSLVIQEKLFTTQEFQNSKTILFYASFDGEVETHEMMLRAMEIGKKIALPTIIRGQQEFVPVIVDNLASLENGPYGIKQPKLDPSQELRASALDLCVVPGVAFDRQNHRLGRGAGYYDRFLNTLPKEIPSIGLAFCFQLVDALPKQAHDVPVSFVISD